MKNHNPIKTYTKCSVFTANSNHEDITLKGAKLFQTGSSYTHPVIAGEQLSQSHTYVTLITSTIIIQSITG